MIYNRITKTGSAFQESGKIQRKLEEIVISFEFPDPLCHFSKSY